jgi:glutamate/tyrosine decarboxylase-like PLP-dependent enzyme
MILDPPPGEMQRLGHRAVDLAVDHLAQIRDRRVVTPPVAAELRELVREPLPATGTGLDATLTRFFDEVLPRATLVNHPRFFAYVPGPGSFAGAVGAFVAAATNLFVGTWLGGAVMAQLEVQVLDWIRLALGLPPPFATGIVTTGGSMANLGALAAARARAGGRLRVYTSTEAHYSLAKSARVLGVRAADLVALPVDREQRLVVEALAAALADDRAAGRVTAAVCATAGTTSTGAIDPLEACADLCAAHGAWLHVDGAYGAAAALLPEHADLRRALARADSITLDPHKWLYAPFEAGCLLVRDEAALRAAFLGDGAYMQDVPRDEVNFFERGPELSRGARALPLWFLLRSVGVDAITDAIRGDQARAARACARLEADARIRIVTPARLSVFSFGLADGDEERAKRWLRAIHADGFTMLSSSRVDGRFVLRFCVVNHATSDADVDASVDRILALLDGS